jgi:preprotein translocase subunit SecA
LGGGQSSEDKLVLRGLHFAIVDEADSVFIDEALTPLILSATVEDASQGENYLHALALANTLVQGKDYVLDRRERSVNLSEAGRDTVAEWSAGRPGIWTSLRAREELVRQALSAQWFFHRDQHYVVTEGKVQIVDESTGRVMPDRSWERGLHQMIEVKEGCEMTARRETLSRITYQRLFRRYLRLAGMTGTAQEAAREIKALYRLDVIRIPPHKPSRRVSLPGGVYGTVAEKWQAVADRTAQLALSEGRPVLIGTRSVEASEQISAVLAQRGIDHALLNAKQDQSESEVIARAGEAGRADVRKKRQDVDRFLQVALDDLRGSSTTNRPL